MRAGTILEFAPPPLGPGSLKLRASSLFPNILHVSPCSSIFCTDSRISGRTNSKKTNTLAVRSEVEPGANSLFRNILRASPCGSRFCAPSEIFRSHKSNETNILEEVIEKKMETGMETCSREGPDSEQCQMLAATENELHEKLDFGWRSASSAALKAFLSARALAPEGQRRVAQDARANLRRYRAVPFFRDSTARLEVAPFPNRGSTTIDII